MKKFLSVLTATVLISASAPKNPVNITIVGKNGTYTYGKSEISLVLGEPRLNCMSEVIDFIAKSEYVAPIDSKIIFNPDDKDLFTVTKESVGRAVDTDALKSVVRDCLSLYGGMVNVPFYTLKPSRTYAEMRNYTHPRTSFSTDYSFSGAERASNIRLATASINGTVIEDGEEFSFNKTVGERTKNRGFLDAKIIVDGKFTEGVGGGVCQVSTTLYNAVLLSGLKVTEHHAHTLAVSYVDMSFDAMVSSDYADLKFKNDTGGPIFIKGVADGQTLTFTIYGAKQTKNYERESVIVETVEPKAVTVYTDELQKGERRVLSYGKRGYKTQGYLIERQGDKTVRRLIRTDSYKAVDFVTEEGNRGFSLVG